MDHDFLAGMMDVSILKPDNTIEHVRRMGEFARKHRCIAVFSLPAFIPDVVRGLEGDKSIEVGGPVGFPSGGELTSIKIFQTKELISAGCTEIDMVVNVGFVKSGQYDRAVEDIRGVIEAAGETPVKVIFECYYLEDDEIRRLCGISAEAGAEYIKTGTGWAPTGATPENVALMKSEVGDSVKIKAAGGVRDLETVEELYGLGAVRFGVGLDSAVTIFEQLAGR